MSAMVSGSHLAEVKYMLVRGWGGATPTASAGAEGMFLRAETRELSY